MKAMSVRSLLIIIIGIFTMSLMVGCSHLEKAPNREGYYMYHKPLPEADRELEAARMAGKDKECPAEYNAAKDMVDKAFAIYMECRNQEAMDMSREAIGKIKALCPAKRVAEVKPEPKPMPVTRPPEPKPEPTPPPPPPPVAEPVKITLEDIHFDFDKATLTKVARDILDSNIKTLKENQGVNVQIEGHTCAHGKDKYNMVLGERRANAVKEYLVNQGIDSIRLTTISYGETRLAMPEIPTPRNKESREAKTNRRVHFEVIVK